MFKKILMAICVTASTAAVQAADVKPASFTKDTLVLEQRTALLEHAPGIKDGDIGHALYFEGELYYHDNKAAGTLYGSTVAVGVTVDHNQHEVRHRELVFVINEQQIVAAGISGYADNIKWKTHGHEWHALDLPIVGGTGEFTGVFGSVKTKKLKNNIFVHTLTMYRPILP